MSTPTETAAEGLTLAEVADLAAVRRPVVTMWRKRYATGDQAFPVPLAHVRGMDRFDRRAVVAWLQATGRDDGRRLAEEAVTIGEPPLPTPDGYVLAQALLALAALTGEPIVALDQEDAADLAAEVDGDDVALRRDIEDASNGDVLALGPYVDALLDCSYGPTDAMDRLTTLAPRFGLAPDTSGLSLDVRRFVRRLAEALAEPLRYGPASDARAAAGGPRGSTPCPLIDPTGCSDLTWSIDDHDWPDGVVLPVSTSALGDRGEARASRATWRRLWVSGASVSPLPGGDGVTDPGPCIVVAAFPHPGDPASDPGETLEAVDAIVRGLRADQCAIVVGPAETLVDALPAIKDGRDYVLRSGALRAALRLPVGARTGMPHAHMALWVLGAAQGEQRAAHRRTAVADLAGLVLAEVTDDVVADVLAAIDDRAPEGRDEAPERHQVGHSWSHIYRVARYELTSDVRDRAALVPRHVRATTRPRAVGGVPLVDVVRPDLRGISIELERGRHARPRGAVSTVAELVTAKRLRVVKGLRLATHLASPGVIGPTVVGTAELSGVDCVGRRRVELLALTAAHPRAQLTNPGDVVFVTAPRLAAWVDAQGGSVVEYPARVLRILPDPDDKPPRPQRLLPRVIAADLLRGTPRAWQSTPIRLIPIEAADALGRALDTAHYAREEALARARDLELLTNSLADGVVAGEFTTLLTSTAPVDIDQAPDQEGH
ncbi:MAG: hypothetical protein LCH98_10945 [Actinobacteria bacterium]|nr:hypothetical protein [Actinomycetota bacterium]